MAYADNIAAFAEDEEEMRGILGKIERYLERKGLEVNVEKSKILRCRKG